MIFKMSRNPGDYREASHEPWLDTLLPSDGISTLHGIRDLRCTVPRRTRRHILLLHGSIAMHGLRSTRIPGKPARHRVFSTCSSGRALSHGICGKVSNNTLAQANEGRDWRIWADLAQVLIGMARELYRNDDFGLEPSQPPTPSSGE